MRLDFSPIANAYQRLSSRERRLLEGAVGVMIAIGFYSLVWAPLQVSQVELAKRIQVKQRELVEMQQMRDTYLDLLNQFELRQKIIDKADPKFALFPHIESTVTQVLGGRDKIASMNPQNKDLGGAYREESVELKLNGVSLQQLEDLMYHIEKGGEPLRLTRLQVKKRARDPQTFDITATVSMLKALDAGKSQHPTDKGPEPAPGQPPAPAVGASAVGAPAVGASAVGAPAAGAPAVGAPAVGAPAVGAPAVGGQPDEQPVGRAPEQAPADVPPPGAGQVPPAAPQPAQPQGPAPAPPAPDEDHA